jgi:hypothetical protein
MPASEVLSGTGDPNGVQHGNPGDLYQDQTGKLWINTGAPTTWTQVSTGSGGDASQRFNWIVNGTENTTFTVTIPVPMPDNQYVVEVTLQGASDNAIVAQVPESSKTTTTFDITTNDTVTGGDVFGIYIAAKTAPDNVPIPRVDSYSQGAGSPGDVIQVFGQFFTGATAVDVNGTNAPVFTVDNDNQITLTLPAGFTTGPIDVTTPAGTGVGPAFTRNSFVIGAPMATARETFAFGRLNDGRAIAAGGAPNGSGSGPYISSCEIYDPATNTWTTVLPMSTPRSRPLAIVLPSGKFLVAGGFDNTNTTLTSAEIYDPVANTWTPTGALPVAMVAEAGAPILITAGPNAGNVLVAFNGDGHGTFYNQSFIYNVVAGTWGSAAAIPARFDGTTIGLASGNILGVGCRALSAPVGNEIHSALWDPATNTWSNKADLLVATRGPGVVQLNAGPSSGSVLVAGGLNASTNQSLSDVQLYDPTANSWSIVSSMAVPRSEFALDYMSDGRIIALGGIWVGNGVQSSAQIFDQPTLSWTSVPDLPQGQVTGHSFGGNAAISVNGFYMIYGGASASSGITATNLVQIYTGPP